ncbi:MAG: hypothetical protein J2P52_08830 [Blastocatellia bacterium]|nr:hypothetical protein [Blastocatellia bacterium]
MVERLVCSELMEAELIVMALAFPTRGARAAVEFEAAWRHNPQAVAQLAARQASARSAAGDPVRDADALDEADRFALS